MDNTIYILDLKNCQEEYVAALEFIKIIEGKKSDSIESRKDTLLKLAERITVSVGSVRKNLSPRYLEQPISVSGKKAIIENGIQNKHSFCLDVATALDKKLSGTRYLIRIHFEESRQSGVLEESELIHLQYLAMFLKNVGRFITRNIFQGNDELDNNLAEKKLKNYLTIFMVPVTGDVYPYQNKNGKIDGTTYLFISRYLRLLSKRYTGVIYGVDLAEDPVVTSLNFRKNKKYKTHFPLIIIDAKVYDSLFIDSIKNILDELFLLKSNGRFRESRNEDPRKALVDFIAETDLYHIRDTVSSESCLKILEFLKSRQEISLMEFSLFAFLLSMQATDKQYLKIWHFAHEISQGLRQVAQNAIQHTESGECFFSFYLHMKKDEEESKSFVNRITKFYPYTCIDMSENMAALEILISDLNEKEDMVDNFISNLNYELNIKGENINQKNLQGHSKLIKCREKLALRNFFSVYESEDAIEEWKCFRQEDLIAHIGLSQFALAAEKCKASVKVISNKYSKLTDEKRVFYKAYSAENKLGMDSGKRYAYIIPGTQFSILIPVQPWNSDYSMGIGQLIQQGSAIENYASFASFLDYDEKRIPVLLKKSGTYNWHENSILDAKRKYRLVQRWRGYWEKKFEENIEVIKSDTESKGRGKYVFNYDFSKVSKSSYFNNEDRIEVCLKGMINALDIANNLDECFLVAFTNLPQGFVENFQKISVQLSVRCLPLRIQLFLQEGQDGEEKGRRVIMAGRDFSQAIGNAYTLSMEHGIAGFDVDDCKRVRELKTILMPKTDQREEVSIGICPFDTIIRCSATDERTLFERQLKEMAEGLLDEQTIGYKLNDTHMRLGNKMHIESFYEMSVLFYRTTIANRLAFHILRQMRNWNKEENKIDFVNDNILFYGYASYSKAILTSVSEILREYRKVYSIDGDCQLGDKVAIAAFQHNLMTESEKTQMYYDLPSENFPGKVGIDHHLHIDREVKVIQIVPISSTLTTFDKMWKAFLDSVIMESRENICLARNYTVFWVVDQNGDLEKGLPSQIEKKYWKKAMASHEIVTNLPFLIDSHNQYIQYFIRSAVIWHDPLDCKLCYPRYVINEVPLVETDPTSTVPTQQIRHSEYYSGSHKGILNEDYDRFAKLKDCVSYDHIWRRQNHYQFFIDTQQYFYHVKDMVKTWLSGQREELKEENDTPVMHIIFSPEHNTNVGFVQYVNTYCFNGLAEIVSIKADKHFRSNFICEHAALKRKIEELHRDRLDKTFLPVRFYFADDTITTGDTFQRANGLLHSLVPMGEYPVKLFSKVFVLVDRLSDETKQMYVEKPEQNFKSFLHVDVSNIRTHGDSCIGCKLEQDAKKLYKRSATKNMAKYWAQKLNDYKEKAYDDREKIVTIDKEKSYQMLLFSHVLQNIIVKQGNCNHMGDAYDIVLNLMLWLLKVGKYDNDDIYGYGRFLMDMRNLNGVCKLLKTICRPFFTYDFKIKRQSYTFFIFLIELMLGEKRENIIPKELESYSEFLFNNNRISKTEELAESIKRKIGEENKSELDFLKVYMLEGLTDMGSTYPMRMQTLKKFYAYLESEERGFSDDEKCLFWDSYVINIHRLVTGAADESRELWLEYMYMTGMEYRDFYEKYDATDAQYTPKFFYEAITEKELSNPESKYFYLFCHNLFLQNTGINFDGLEDKCDNLQTSKPMDEDFLKDCWMQMRSLDSFRNPEAVNSRQVNFSTKNEEKLFDLLKRKEVKEREPSVEQWYEKFLDYIVRVIDEKYSIGKMDINIAILTRSNEKTETTCIQQLDIVKENINFVKTRISETRYCIKERVIDALNNKNLFDLENIGYTISSNTDLFGEERPYVIAFFDDPRKSKTAMSARRLARVFLYISISACDDINTRQLILRLILRDVMMYRNRILRSLEKDFAGEIYASYAHTIGEKNILSHEKAHSHAATADDEISLEIFQGKKHFERGNIYKKISSNQAANWLLLRSYTNGQIAKIFNRSFHDGKERMNTVNAPKLYIPKDRNNYGNNIFGEKLDIFSKLNLKNEFPDIRDGRLELLNEIIDIRYDKILEGARFIQGGEGQCYNLEYFKCILIDIMMSAIKFESDKPDFLTRIDRFLEINSKLGEEVPKWKEQDWEHQDSEEVFQLIEKLENSRCYIKITREPSPFSGIDYLVIRNPVKDLRKKLKNWNEENRIIMHRLEDPLDYADGHMSLLAIKRYIENLDETRQLKCVFQYTMILSEESGCESLYFENRLPVLQKEVV